MKRITIKMLKDANACADQVRIFKRVFPNGAPVSMASTYKARKAGLDIWFAERWLSAQARKVYDEAAAQASKVYNEATTQAWEVSNKTIAQARKVYNEATTPAWEVYNKTIAQARKVYDEATTPAWEVYDEATTQALIAALAKEEKP